MDYARDLFAHNDTIQALANLFGLIAGIALIVTATRWTVRFTHTVYNNSLRFAIAIVRRTILRRLVEMAGEPTSLIAFLSMTTSLMFISVGAIAFSAFPSVVREAGQDTATDAHRVVEAANTAFQLVFVLLLCFGSLMTLLSARAIIRINRRRRKKRLSVRLRSTANKPD
jgi:hypothetical protein